MKKIIFALCIISIALIGFSAVSASGDYEVDDFHVNNNMYLHGLGPKYGWDLYGDDGPFFPPFPYPGPRQ